MVQEVKIIFNAFPSSMFANDAIPHGLNAAFHDIEITEDDDYLCRRGSGDICKYKQI